MELLKHEPQLPVAQVGEGVVIEAFHRYPVEPITAAAGPVEAAKDVHRRALSRARRSHHRQVVAPLHRETEVIEGANQGVAAAVDLAHMVEFGHRTLHRDRLGLGAEDLRG